MRSKESYFLRTSCDSIDRLKFRGDLIKVAFEKKCSIATALRQFFVNGQEFSDRERGLFALYSSSQANLVEGAVTLFKALGIDQTQASGEVYEHGVVEYYFGVRVSDPSVWYDSWTIDTLMDWPLGTSVPASKDQLKAVYNEHLSRCFRGEY
jgi:hypothetical protein